MYNPHAEKMQRFTESGCVACTSAEEVAELCDTVFLCVKPQIFPEVLRVIAPTVAKKNADDVVIVSIAAGVTFAGRARRRPPLRACHAEHAAAAR